jgi:hypothetical protein
LLKDHLLILAQINWQTVSDELNLPSKGAAAKRYSRLPGKYDIASPAKKVAKVSSISPDAEDNEETPEKTKGKPKAKKAATPAKKRKVAEVEEDDDDDEAVKSEVEDDD